MKRRLTLIILAAALGGLLFFGATALAQQQIPQNGKAVSHPPAANGNVSIPDHGWAERQNPNPALKQRRRISIPYGFADTLPLSDSDVVTASGHGACTAGEEVTVDVTITQTVGGYLASGSAQFQQTCTGQLQSWQVAVPADPGSNFVDGPATACGTAVTRDETGVTDTFDWCKVVRLNWQLYLPLITE